MTLEGILHWLEFFSSMHACSMTAANAITFDS